MTEVLFLWNVENDLKRYFMNNLGDCPGITLIFPEKDTQSELIKFARTCDVMVGWRPSRELLEEAPRLGLFINPGIGVQHVLPLFRSFRSSRSIILANSHGNAGATAQHAVAMLLCLTNKILPHHQWMAEGKWRTGDQENPSILLRNEKVGLLGYGHVNRAVHQLLSGFPLSFYVLRRHAMPPTAYKNTHQLTLAGIYHQQDIHEFLNQVNIVMCALPLTERTEGILSEKELRLIGPNGLLVNVGRGPVIDEKSLFLALKQKLIRGAAVDVWYNYQPEPDGNNRKYPYNYPFHTLENIIMSPHRAASPFDDPGRWDDVIENIRRYSRGADQFLNKIDIDAGY